MWKDIFIGKFLADNILVIIVLLIIALMILIGYIQLGIQNLKNKIKKIFNREDA